VEILNKGNHKCSLFDVLTGKLKKPILVKFSNETEEVGSEKKA